MQSTDENMIVLKTKDNDGLRSDLSASFMKGIASGLNSSTWNPKDLKK